MQRRFHVSWHEDFADALKAKRELQSQNPDNRYQIRQRTGRRFALVIRVPTSEVLDHPDRVVKTRRPRRHGGR